MVSVYVDIVRRMFSFKCVLLAIIGILVVVSAAPDRFDNYRVYSLKIENEVQRESLVAVRKVLTKPVDFWKGSNQVNAMADIMVAPEDQTIFEDMLLAENFKWQLKIENVQELIDGEQAKVRPRIDGVMEWESYHTFDEIMAWMDELLVQYPDILTDVRIGYSVEGRPMRGLKLSKREGRQALLIESNTHAREWITAATSTHFLNELLTSTDTKLVYLANNFDWIIFPIVNPDGYVYSFENNRMWRKNRSRHALICLGVDPNRNWAYQWATDVQGSSINPCDETYTGPNAFSEPEVKSLADYMAANKGYIKAFLSFHSYSQLILYPWSYTSSASPDEQLLHEIAEVTAAGIKSVHGTEYTPQASNALYPHHGTSVDWTYGDQGILLSYTFEFRDTGSFGFLLPADQIIPNAEETAAGLYAFVMEAVMRNLLEIV